MPQIACSPKGRHCCLQRGVNATLLADCSRAGLCVSPWQDRQFSWLRTLCWNGNPEHQVSGWSSKSCSLFVAALKGRSRKPSRSLVCGGPSFTENFEPLQNGLSLPGAVCFVKLRPSESSLGQPSRGGPQQPPPQSSQGCMTSWAPWDHVLQHRSTQTEPWAIQHSVQDPQEQMQHLALFTEQSTSTETLTSLIPGGYAGVTSSLSRL